MPRKVFEEQDMQQAYQDFLLGLVQAMHAADGGAQEQMHDAVLQHGELARPLLLPVGSHFTYTDKVAFAVPLRLAIYVTSLPREASRQEFESTMYPLLLRLWRREQLRLQSLARPQDDAAGGEAGAGAAAMVETQREDRMQVVRITLSEADARKYFAGDPDLGTLEEMEEDVQLRELRDERRARVEEMQRNGQPLLPEDLRGSGELHYVARRRTRKTDINMALWGNSIELWCKEDELRSLYVPGYDDDDTGSENGRGGDEE